MLAGQGVNVAMSDLFGVIGQRLLGELGPDLQRLDLAEEEARRCSM